VLLFAGSAAAEAPGEHGGEAGHGAAAEAGHEEAGHGAEAHAEGHGGHKVGHDLGEINWYRWYYSPGYTKEEGAPFIAMVLNFLVLFGLLWYFSRNSVANFLRERRDKLMASIDEASRLKKEAEERHIEFETKLQKMDQEEEKIREDLLAAAVREQERLVADAGARAEKMRAEAKRLADQEIVEARTRLRNEMADRAVDVARGILEKKLGPGEQRKLVEQYIGNLDNPVAS